MQIVGQTWLKLVTWTCGSWIEGQHDVYFTVQWFCLISWRLFDVCTSYFWSMNQYDPTVDLKINVGCCDLYFMVQRLCLIPWRLFHVWTSLFGIMNQYDPTHDLKINVGHRDLHFMVQWFYVLSLKTISCMNIIIWDYESVWPNAWPQSKCRSPWPIFHGPIISCYILKTIWCMIINLGDYGSVWPDVWPLNKCMSLWPIFHGPLIFPYVSKTIWWMSIIFR